MKEDQKEAMQQALDGVYEAIKSTGNSGIPSGHLYAMMMEFGCSIDVFEYLISTLKKEGKITENNYLLKANQSKEI